MVDKEDNKEESNKQSENPKINVFGLNIDSGLLFLTSLAIGLGAAGFTWYTNNQKQQPTQQSQPQLQQPTQEQQDQLYREYIQNELRRRNQIRQQQEQQPLPLTGNNHVYVNPSPNDNNIEVGALLDMGKTRNYLNPPNVNHYYTMPEIPNEGKAPMINMGIYRKRDEENEEQSQQQEQDEAGYSNEELMNRVNNNSYY